jgi:hypothetical protein
VGGEAPDRCGHGGARGRKRRNSGGATSKPSATASEGGLLHPGRKNEDPDDLARGPPVSATSSGGLRGEKRLIASRARGRRSQTVALKRPPPGGEALTLTWKSPVFLRQIR